MESFHHAPVNALQHIYQHLTELPQIVKKHICEECSWSLPTYYRKANGAAISNAEKEKIIAIVFAQLQRSWEQCKNGHNPPPAPAIAPL
jgi:hypothetical protein